jgi:hypothetical protein
MTEGSGWCASLRSRLLEAIGVKETLRPRVSYSINQILTSPNNYLPSSLDLARSLSS